MSLSAYREMCAGRNKWAAWLNTLQNKSGVYIIRRARGGRTLYVGESHSGRLKKTLMRHFWSWTGKTAGVTYDPHAVEVSIEIMPKNRAVARQNELIDRLQPEDNDINPVATARRDAEEDGNPF